MPEYSRILIEEYCMQHPKTKKADFLRKMVTMSYDIECAAIKREPLVDDLMPTRGFQCFE